MAADQSPRTCEGGILPECRFWRPPDASWQKAHVLGASRRKDLPELPARGERVRWAQLRADERQSNLSFGRRAAPPFAIRIPSPPGRNHPTLLPNHVAN